MDKMLREELEVYLVGTLQAIDCPSLIVRSVEDHLHCLCRLSHMVTIEKLAEQMQVESSSWVKKQSAALRDFYWQSGYGVFSGEPLQCPTSDDLHRESGGTSSASPLSG